MTAHTRFLANKNFGSLNGLRAISILAVIWHHTAPAWANPTLVLMGTQGVTLFFAISGFLITTLLLRERDRNGSVDLKAFYTRRTLRIFPLYYGVLLLYIVVVAVMEPNSSAGQNFFHNLVYFATYTSNIFVPLDGRVIFYFSWSLAAEEQFYLLWPGVLFLLRTPARAWWALSLMLLACVVGQVVGNRFLSAVPLAIVAGAWLAVTLHSEKGYRVLSRVLGRGEAFAVLAVLQGLALTLVDAPPFLVHLLFTAMVGACVVREDHPAAPLLALKPLAYMGTISYGMYMLHMLCKNAVVKLLPVFNLPADGLLVFPFTIVAAVVVATLSFKYYESFFLSLKHRYER